MSHFVLSVRLSAFAAALVKAGSLPKIKRKEFVQLVQKETANIERKLAAKAA